MNSLLAANYLDTRQSYVDKLAQTEDTTCPWRTKQDALMKWVSIVEAYELLGINADTVLELGCAAGPLCLHFKKSVPKVIGVDIATEGFVQYARQVYIKHGIEYLTQSVLDLTLDYSIDVITDACAMGCSHMDKRDVVSKVASLLGPGGYFITTGDTNLAVTNPTAQFISPSTWISICKDVGLCLVSKFEDQPNPLKQTNDLNIVRLVFQKQTDAV
jgi:SAM-dependent methyltransferase